MVQDLRKLSDLSASYRLAVLLVISQVALTGGLIGIVTSNWYSAYFNQTLKEELLESCSRPGGSKVVAGSGGRLLLERTVDRPGLRNSLLDGEGLEELILSQLRDKLPINASIERLQSLQRRSQSPELEAVLREKLLRCELLAAQQAIGNEDQKRAEEYIADLSRYLKEQNSDFGYGPQQRYVTAFLHTSAALKRLCGDEHAASELDQLPEKLEDPDFAKKWYAENGMPGYENSYPAEYAVRYALNRSWATTDRAPWLIKALEAAFRPGIQPATKFGVLKDALTFAAMTHNAQLGQASLKLWLHDGDPNAKLTTTDQATVAVCLIKPVLASGSAVMFKALNRQIYGAIAAGLIPRDLAQTVFDDYLGNESAAKSWPPKNPADASEKVALADKLIALGRAKGIVPSTLEIARASALLEVPDLTSAGAALQQLIGKTPQLTLNSEQQVWLSKALLRYVQVMRDRGKDQAGVACDLVESALQHRPWADQQKVELWLAVAGACEPLGRPAQLQRCKDALCSLGHSKELSDRLQLDFHLLLWSVQSGDPQQGLSWYREAEKHYSADSDDFCTICAWLLGYTRSFPSYSPKHLAIAKSGQFPEEAFLRAPVLSKKLYGVHSPQYLGDMLWLAQYKFCQGHFDQAAKYCQQITNSSSATTSEYYVAASDMLNEMGVGPAVYRQDTQIAARCGTLNELNLLHSIYRQVYRMPAAQRVLQLEKQIKEVD